MYLAENKSGALWWEKIILMPTAVIYGVGHDINNWAGSDGNRKQYNCYKVKTTTGRLRLRQGTGPCLADKALIHPGNTEKKYKLCCWKSSSRTGLFMLAQ